MTFNTAELRYQNFIVHAQCFKGEGKVYPTTDNEGPESEKRYSSILSLTSELNGGGWLAVRLQPLYPRERDQVSR